jgi:hypothetical protein
VIEYLPRGIKPSTEILTAGQRLLFDIFIVLVVTVSSKVLMKGRSALIWTCQRCSAVESSFRFTELCLTRTISKGVAITLSFWGSRRVRGSVVGHGLLLVEISKIGELYDLQGM